MRHLKRQKGRKQRDQWRVEAHGPLVVGGLFLTRASSEQQCGPGSQPRPAAWCGGPGAIFTCSCVLWPMRVPLG